MFYLIEINEESHAFEAEKILERFLGRHAETPPEGADTGIGIWNLVLAHRLWVFRLQKYTFSKKRQGNKGFPLIAITENPADIQLFDAIAKMGNQIEKELMKGE